MSKPWVGSSWEAGWRGRPHHRCDHRTSRPTGGGPTHHYRQQVVAGPVRSSRRPRAWRELRPLHEQPRSSNGLYRMRMFEPELTYPRLVRRADGTVLLVEGVTCRLVTDPVCRALEATLGPPSEPADSDQYTVSRDSRSEIMVAAGRDLSALARLTPAAALIVVRSARAVPREFEGSARDLVLGDGPYGGKRVLDRLALIRAERGSHLLVPSTERDALRRNHGLADHLARRARIVAASAAGSLWELPPAPAPGPPKVFCIGLNKTGTTSFHQACELAGLRSFHWGAREAFDGVLAAQRGGERLLQHVGEGFDAYSDIETLSVRFDVADVQYPGSRFVLTVRDVDAWIDSRRRHVERNRREQAAGRYHGRNLTIDEDRWRAQWHGHVERVQSYFTGRDDLLILDITAGEGWERFAPFLDRPIPNVPFPHGNADRRSRATTKRASSVPSPARAGSDASEASTSRNPTPTVSGRRTLVQRRLSTAWRHIRSRLP